MGSSLGKASEDTGGERNMPKQKMMRRHGEPLPLELSELFSDGIEFGGEYHEHQAE